MDLRDATTRIVSAYLGRNDLPLAELPVLISQVFDTLQRLASPVEVAVPPQEPAVPVKKSVTPEHLVCLECGSKAKMLKRHLQVAHGMTPEQYRDKWSLARDYPLVAPGYAKLRSELAMTLGLGRRGRDATVVPLNARKEKPV